MKILVQTSQALTPQEFPFLNQLDDRFTMEYTCGCCGDSHVITLKFEGYQLHDDGNLPVYRMETLENLVTGERMDFPL